MSAAHSFKMFVCFLTTGSIQGYRAKVILFLKGGGRERDRDRERKRKGSIPIVGSLPPKLTMAD